MSHVDVEVSDLRLAVVTSQHRSLRQAAEALNIRQSSLSRRLHEIERQLAVVLFERTKGGTNLTTVGREFVAIATRILDGVETELRFSSSHNESPGLIQGGGGTSRSYPRTPAKSRPADPVHAAPSPRTRIRTVDSASFPERRLPRQSAEELCSTMNLAAMSSAIPAVFRAPTSR